MIRIGIIGAENSHTGAIAKTINIDKKVKGAKVVAVWGETRAFAKAAAEKALNSFTGAITGALKKGDSVTLVGFGTFSISKRAQRKGRNPQTGAEITIKASNLPKFKAGKALKDAVN